MYIFCLRIGGGTPSVIKALRYHYSYTSGDFLELEEMMTPK
jgi:hypothetical protein